MFFFWVMIFCIQEILIDCSMLRWWAFLLLFVIKYFCKYDPCLKWPGNSRDWMLEIVSHLTLCLSPCGWKLERSLPYHRLVQRFDIKPSSHTLDHYWYYSQYGEIFCIVRTRLLGWKDKSWINIQNNIEKFNKKKRKIHQHRHESNEKPTRNDLIKCL